MEPKALVLSGYGLNCERETAYAFEKAGAEADIIHVNDLIESYKKGEKPLDEYQIMAFPGGFSFGDDTGAGNAMANLIKDNLWDELLEFIERDTLMIGICNGFQILTNLGLLPALDKKYGNVEVALVDNESARYRDLWIDLEITSDSPWLEGIDKLSLPIAHGEGNFYATDEVLDLLNENGLVAAKYVHGEICKYHDRKEDDCNPNGSIGNIAGITDETRRILGLMPHPERALDFTHRPDWTCQKEILKREGKELPEEGQGLQIFRNAVNYFA